MSIAVIINQLEQIVEANKESPPGLFAALYLKVTIAIQTAINQQAFEGNARMEQFDVIFAQRYLDAYQAYQAGDKCSECWQVAFDARLDNRLLAIQHILLGMNAHINLDLGIAAAEAARDMPIQKLENDFNKINEILLSLLESEQRHINRMSPVLWLLDWLFKKKDEQFAGFSLKIARVYAWSCAQSLHATPAASWPEKINQIDRNAGRLAKEMIRPRRVLGWFIGLVRGFEDRDVSSLIDRIATGINGR